MVKYNFRALDLALRSRPWKGASRKLVVKTHSTGNISIPLKLPRNEILHFVTVPKYTNNLFFKDLKIKLFFG